MYAMLLPLIAAIVIGVALLALASIAIESSLLGGSVHAKQLLRTGAIGGATIGAVGGIVISLPPHDPWIRLGLAGAVVGGVLGRLTVALVAAVRTRVQRPRPPAV